MLLIPRCMYNQHYKLQIWPMSLLMAATRWRCLWILLSNLGLWYKGHLLICTFPPWLYKACGRWNRFPNDKLIEDNRYWGFQGSPGSVTLITQVATKQPGALTMRLECLWLVSFLSKIPSVLPLNNDIITRIRRPSFPSPQILRTIRLFPATHIFQ